VVVARGPVSSADAVLVVTPDGGLAGSVFEEPAVRNHNGPVLVILPKWNTVMHEERFNWVQRAGLRRVPADAWLRIPDENDPRPPPPEAKGAQDALRKALEELREEQKADPTRISLSRDLGGRLDLYVVGPQGQLSLIARSGTIDAPQTFRYAPGWRPAVVDAEGRPVLIVSEEGPYFALAEPDLVNTQGLASLETARALEAMLDQAFGREASFVFDVSMHGLQRSRSFLRQAFEPPFLAATLCGVAALVLMGWHAFVRFGPAARQDRAFAMGKRALADNQADLIKMTGREHRMGAPYGAVVRDLAARAVGAPRDTTPEALDELLDRLGEGGRTSWPLSTLRRDIEQATDPGELVRAAERLHQWKTEMTRERQ
jgi:hypothetical protein